jgi:hypothetical protein
MIRLFRKYHRWIATILCLPLLTTVLSGIGYTIADEWLHIEGAGGLMMSIHTFSFLHLNKFLPILNGIGLFGLLVTGMSMTRIFHKSSLAKQRLEREV